MKKSIKLLLPLLLVAVFVGCGPRVIPVQRPNNNTGTTPTPDTEQGGGDVEDSYDGKHVVILSMDAFRHDLASMYDTPTLVTIAS